MKTILIIIGAVVLVAIYDCIYAAAKSGHNMTEIEERIERENYLKNLENEGK